MNLRAILFLTPFLVTACSGASPTEVSSSSLVGVSPDDPSGPLPAYYDAQLFEINLKEEPAQAETALIVHNGSINTIYESNTPVNGQMFVPVLDAIQGDGFNPLWREVEITFNVAPFQLTRDDDVTAAAAAGQITLNTTNEMYRCSVIGSK